MKNNVIKTFGLTGIAFLAACSTPKYIGGTVEGTIQGTKLSEKETNPIGYNLEKYTLFNGKNYGKGQYDTRPRVAFHNDDLNKGELEFIICLREDISIIGSTTNKNSWAEKGKKYIPTIFNGKNGKPFTEFEIYDIPKRTKKKLKKQSKSFFGHVGEETGNMRGGILPQINILGTPHIYVNGPKGRLIQRDETGKIIETRAFGSSRNNLSELYIPLNQNEYDEHINFDKNKITIISGEGFYLPITEKSQRSVAIVLPQKQKAQTKSPCDCNYKIKKGDTYSKLAGENWRKLVEMNQGVNPRKLQIGQIIKIPCKYKNK